MDCSPGSIESEQTLTIELLELGLDPSELGIDGDLGLLLHERKLERNLHMLANLGLYFVNDLLNDGRCLDLSELVLILLDYWLGLGLIIWISGLLDYLE